MKKRYLLGIMLLSLCLFGMRGIEKTEQESVITPNVEGLKIETAVQILESLGLRPRIQGASPPSALVVWQAPQPGFPLMVGEEITLSSEPRVTSMPTVPAVTMSRSISETTPPEGQSSVTSVEPKSATRPENVKKSASRRYPRWYPQRLLKQQESQIIVSPPSPDNHPSTVTSDAAGTSSVLRFPKVAAPDGSVIQRDDEYRVGVYETTTTPATPVPNLLRLCLEDALLAIQKAGLLPGDITYAPSGNVGVIDKQAPPPYILVPAGTKVHLWLAN